MVPSCARFIAIILTVFSTIQHSRPGELSIVDSSCYPKELLGRYSEWTPTHKDFSKNTNEKNCITEPKCICVENQKSIAMHCGGILDARIEYITDNIKHFEITCNESLDFNLSQTDFHSNLKLNYSYSIVAQFNECPEPFRPYSTLLRPSNEYGESETQQNFPVIKRLSINCTRRMNFVVDKKHFLELQQLDSLTIECNPLSELPEDMFDGMTKVDHIKIFHTSIEHLPNKIFSKLAGLRILFLPNNRIRSISKDIFSDLIALEYLDLRNNLISVVDNEAFKQTRNIIELRLDNNRITRLPNYLDKMKNLTDLIIWNNLIGEIEVDDCRPHQVLDSNYNSTDSSCVSSRRFPKLMNTIFLDFSGNRINKLPKTVTEMNILQIFKMSRNSGKLKTLRKFLTSSNLMLLDVSNSSIESIDSEFLSQFPVLWRVDFSKNKIDSLPEGLFRYNPKLKKVDFNNNDLTFLPRKLFINNPKLRYVHLSGNRISNLDSDLFSDKIHLEILDISKNLILELKGDVFVSPVLNKIDFSFNEISELDSLLLRNCCDDLVFIDISNNNLEQIEKESFWGLYKLETLNISNNKLTYIDLEIFEDLISIQNLDFSNNYLYEFDYLQQPIEPPDTLKELNLNGNRLTIIKMYFTGNIEGLYLSRNNITEVTIAQNSNFQRLTLSYNPLKALWLPFISNGNMMEVDLSHNNMSFCDTIFYSSEYEIGFRTFEKGITFCPYNSLDYSHNKIDFDSSLSRINTDNMLWGKTTRLSQCNNIKVFDFSYNSIKHVLLDWRDDPMLEVIDVRYNKIPFLKEQDILFDNSKGMERRCVLFSDDPVEVCERNLTLDLRHNEIRGVEFPSRNLVVVPSNCNRTMNHSHATVLIDHNPFYCGLGILNFLRYVEEDVTLVSEVTRRTGENKALPAKIIPGNLTCSEPELVTGKKVMEPETYLHQIMPMIGLSALMGSIEEEDIENT